MLFKDGCRDTGCGIKIFKRSDFLKLPHFDNIHRFLPALFTSIQVQRLMSQLTIDPAPRANQSTILIVSVLGSLISLELFGSREEALMLLQEK